MNQSLISEDCIQKMLSTRIPAILCLCKEWWSLKNSICKQKFKEKHLHEEIHWTNHESRALRPCSNINAYRAFLAPSQISWLTIPAEITGSNNNFVFFWHETTASQQCKKCACANFLESADYRISPATMIALSYVYYCFKAIKCNYCDVA